MYPSNELLLIYLLCTHVQPTPEPSTDSSRRTWHWRASGRRPSQTCQIWWRCKRCDSVLCSDSFLFTAADSGSTAVFISESSKCQNTWVTSIQMPSATSWACGICELPAGEEGERGKREAVSASICVFQRVQSGSEWRDWPRQTLHESMEVIYSWVHKLATCSVLKRYPDCHCSKPFMVHSMQ